MSLIDFVYAQTTNNCPSPPLPCITPISGTGFTNITDVLLLVIRGLLFIAGALAVIFIIVSGYQYITSAGNPEQATKGKSGLIYAIIGIIIISLSYAIVNVVTNTLRGGFTDGGGQQAPVTGPGSGTGQQGAPTGGPSNPLDQQGPRLPENNSDPNVQIE